SEQENRPGSERDGRPTLEHDGREILRLEQHVPKAQRTTEVDRQQQTGEDRADGGDVVPRAYHGAVLGPAEPVQRGGEEVGAAREPAHEEVQDDEPGPVRRAAEEGVRHYPEPPLALRGFARPCAASAGRRAPARPKRRRSPPRRWSSWRGSAMAAAGAAAGRTPRARRPGGRTN